jgi:anaerobic ribonucleoside-triphosphate reductase
MNEEIKLQDSERQQCEVWTRVMGYFRPFKHADGSIGFNDGKASEYKERKWYKERA